MTLLTHAAYWILIVAIFYAWIRTSVAYHRLATDVTSFLAELRALQRLQDRYEPDEHYHWLVDNGGTNFGNDKGEEE